MCNISMSQDASLSPKGPLFPWRTNGISGRYLWAEFLSWFFENFLRKEKMNSFKAYNFFQSVPGNKSYAEISSKQGSAKKNSKFEFKFFFFVYYIFSTWKAFIHSIWICYEKVMDNLIFVAIKEHILEKITCRIHF